MRIVYEPRGRAKEYAPLAANLYRGCTHGCTYCYVPAILRISPEEFIRSTPRPNALKLLEKDLTELQDKKNKNTVLMSFTTDPYNHAETTHHLTRDAIKLFIQHQQPFTILTKAGARSTIDLRLYAGSNLATYATTIHSLDSNLQQQYEPNAAPPSERLEALKQHKEAGVRTWVSIEPVLNPQDAIDLIHHLTGIADLVKVGTLNHVHNETDWPLFREKIVDELQKNNINYYLKQDLQAYATP